MTSTPRPEPSAIESGDGMSIPVVQFVLPDGREKPQSIWRPREIAEKAYRLLGAGLRLEAEILTTGEVALTVADPDEGIDLACEVVPNGPGIAAAFDRLVASVEPQP